MAPVPQNVPYSQARSLPLGARPIRPFTISIPFRQDMADTSTSARWSEPFPRRGEVHESGHAGRAFFASRLAGEISRHFHRRNSLPLFFFRKPIYFSLFTGARDGFPFASLRNCQLALPSVRTLWYITEGMAGRKSAMPPSAERLVPLGRKLSCLPLKNALLRLFAKTSV